MSWVSEQFCRRLFCSFIHDTCRQAFKFALSSDNFKSLLQCVPALREDQVDCCHHLALLPPVSAQSQAPQREAQKYYSTRLLNGRMNKENHVLSYKLSKSSSLLSFHSVATLTVLDLARGSLYPTKLAARHVGRFATGLVPAIVEFLFVACLSLRAPLCGISQNTQQISWQSAGEWGEGGCLLWLDGDRQIVSRLRVTDWWR